MTLSRPRTRHTLALVLLTWLVHVAAPLLHLAEAAGHGAESDRSVAQACSCACHAPAPQDEPSPEPSWTPSSAPGHNHASCAVCQDILTWTGIDHADEAPRLGALLVERAPRAQPTAHWVPSVERAKARGPPPHSGSGQSETP